MATRRSFLSNSRNFIRQPKVKYFVAGMITAYAIKKIAETEAAHNFAVSATAELLNIKDSLEESVENIKEDAEDIHAEAQEKTQLEVFGPDDLEEEVEDIKEKAQEKTKIEVFGPDDIE
ncbi:MAG: hypothetical protein BZ136_00960 [Methanosphaera sp. rholeuAM74]|nr:MAG: hypothetical protein BZ136_00960 [Methanosphaera sp. rholeuAM74]